VTPKASLVELLAQVNVKPEQIKYVGIRHYHGDHVDSFPKAMLLIGNDDWEILSDPKLPYRPPRRHSEFRALYELFSGGGNVEPALLDQDMFGDSTVRE
jgi:N-acyl homoserine lactone hydrolase